MQVIKNHYEMLGVKPGCDFASIKKAYYKRVKECHPDLFKNSHEKEEEFKRLVASFDVLSDPDKRRRFDETLRMKSVSENLEQVSISMEEDASVMDSSADDTLEEMIVGNEPPSETSLATLFLDLQKTEVFISFREGRNLLSNGKYRAALSFFMETARHSPKNILYRYYLAKTYSVLGDFANARKHYHAGIDLGSRRFPPQRLKRFHNELEKINKEHFSLAETVISYFSKKLSTEPYYRVSEEMVDEANKAIARIEKKRKEREKEEKKLLE